MIEPVPGKSCGSCTSCCKIPALDELQKPAGVVCSNCAVGVGCRIYADRPSSCRTFMCGWIYNPHMGPELKPERCGVLIWEWTERRWVVATADPDRPEAWRSPIVLNFLRQTVREVPSDWLVLAACGLKTWRITEHAILSQEGNVYGFVGYRAPGTWTMALTSLP